MRGYLLTLLHKSLTDIVIIHIYTTDLPADFEILTISAVWGFQIPKVLLTFPQTVRFVKTYGNRRLRSLTRSQS